MSETFTRHCSPFGISVFAQGWPEDKFKHACNMLAQMLDNDQDGCADDATVVKTIRINQSGMAMFGTATGAEQFGDQIPATFIWQDLNAEETFLSCSGKDETADCRDAAIEEIFHLVSAVGLSTAYPRVFGECQARGDARSKMQIQVDIARGGHFETVPTTYPATAIYHYTDKTCEYNCMGTEFIYWALTSLLEGQDKRQQDNNEEWEASTPQQLLSKLPGMHTLLTDEETTSMKLLSSDGVLPGSGGGAHLSYQPKSQKCLIPNGCSLDGSGCGPQGNNLDLNRCTAPPPVDAPVDAPVNAPVDAPVSQPVGTYYPSDESACEDNPDFFKKIKRKRRRCNYFAKNVSKRCRKKNVIENCRVSCEVCGKTGEQVCERSPMKELKKKPCKAVSCCQWNSEDNFCSSSVGDDLCFPEE